MAKLYSPKEVLGYFVLNENQSDANIATLLQYLDSFDPVNCRNIINAPLDQYHNRTSIHLSALKGLAKFLQILLEHGGKISGINNNKVCTMIKC